MYNSNTRPLIRRETFLGTILVEVPYDLWWITAIKAVVPQNYRKCENGIWMFQETYYSCVKTICEHVWGSKVVDATGGIASPQTNTWRERWDVERERTIHQHRRQQEREKPPPLAPPTKLAARQILFVTHNAPSEVVRAAWRALNTMLRKDDPDGTKNHAELSVINNAYNELKLRGQG